MMFGMDYIEWEITEFKSKLPSEEYRFIGRCYEDGIERFYLQKQKHFTLFGWRIATTWHDLHAATSLSALFVHVESYRNYEDRRRQLTDGRLKSPEK